MTGIAASHRLILFPRTNTPLAVFTAMAMATEIAIIVINHHVFEIVVSEAPLLDKDRTATH